MQERLMGAIIQKCVLKSFSVDFILKIGFIWAFNSCFIYSFNKDLLCVPVTAPDPGNAKMNTTHKYLDPHVAYFLVGRDKQ